MRKLKYIMYIIAAILILYGILWILSGKEHEIEYGISFNNQHATTLGLDWKQVYIAMLDELKPKYIRISAPWNEVEKEKGLINTEYVDWQMIEAAKRGIKVALVIGQKAPRWPECHVPGWAAELDDEEYEKSLLRYIKYIVERYRNHPGLELWQVENEPFIRFRFGECHNFQENLVEKEIELVRSLDLKHKIMVTDSGELSTWRRASKAGDIFGTTLYRVVRTHQGHVFTYDWLPPVVYSLKAKIWGLEEKDVYISELQAEPWFGSTESVTTTPISEQEKTMNLNRLEKHFNYASRIGFSRAYLWGVEWWYWLKEDKDMEEYWDAVKKHIQ